MSYNQDEGDIKNFLLNRDRQSCQNLVRRHQNAVFRICFNVLKDHQKAEEVAQDVFIKAFDQLNQLNDPVKFRSWIGRMAYHRAIDVWRRQKSTTADLPAAISIADEDQGPIAKVESLERSEQITKALQSLGEPDTSIFTLFYLEEYKIQEIAEAVNLTVSNVKIRLMRGRKVLKNKLIKIYDQI